MQLYLCIISLIFGVVTGLPLKAQYAHQYDPPSGHNNEETVYIGIAYLAPGSDQFSFHQSRGGNIEIGMQTRLPSLPIEFFPALRLSSFSRGLHAAVHDNLLLYQAGMKAGYPVLKNINDLDLRLIPYVGVGYSGGRYYLLFSHHFRRGKHEVLNIKGVTGTLGTGIFYKKYFLSVGYELMRLHSRNATGNNRPYYYPYRRINRTSRTSNTGILNLDHYSISIAYFF